MALSDDELAELVGQLRPFLVTLVQETLRSAGIRRGVVSVSSGVVTDVGVDETADEVEVLLDDSDEPVRMIRTGTGHAEGDRVLVVFHPPSGAFALPAIPT